MAFYFVTGKLGNGKTLCSVGRIRDKLRAGCIVATNINLDLVAMFGPDAKTCRVIRVPDKPLVENLEMIGNANLSYDENKNGLLVLDECGTWFNSRNWQDKSRAAVNQWFLHARKLGWDVLLIVQDISIIDSQARDALSEHTVFCKRLDRVAIPFVGTLFKSLTGFRLSMPRVHMAKVVYGMSERDLLSDRWTYRGNDLFACYDTKQLFLSEYPHGVYSQLTPWHLKGRYRVPRDWGFYMRMTKIFWKRFRSPIALGAGALFGMTLAAAAAFGFAYRDLDQQRAALSAQLDQVAQVSTPAASEPVPPPAGFLDGRRIVITFNRTDGQVIDYVFRVSDGDSHVDLNPGDLYRIGYTVKPVTQCLAHITGHGAAISAMCAPRSIEASLDDSTSL